MSTPDHAAAAQATAWVAEHCGELTAAATRAGLPPRDLDSAAWIAALLSGELDTSKIIASAVYQLQGRPLIARGHRDPRVVSVDLDQALPAGGADPLARLIAAEEFAALVAASRWCSDAARDAMEAPHGRLPDPDPRGKKTRQRKRARERHGQLDFRGWGWQA